MRMKRASSFLSEGFRDFNIQTDPRARSRAARGSVKMESKYELDSNISMAISARAAEAKSNLDPPK